MLVRLLLAVAGALLIASPAQALTGTYGAHDPWDWWGDTCSKEQPYEVVVPTEGAGPFPVFVWVHGTGAEKNDQRLARDTVAAASDRGWVAVFPTYVGGDTVSSNKGIDSQARCMFRQGGASPSMLDGVCSLPVADCTRIAVAGHSQGGMIAMRAANWNPGVRAAVPMSVFSVNRDPAFWTDARRGGSRVLPDANLRVLTDQEDMEGITSWFSGASYSALRSFTGATCADRVRNCLGTDGSGWLVVPHATPPQGPTDGFADHCWMNLDGSRCVALMETDPYWLTGDAPWTLPSTLAWLRGR